jgi:hypothetical protein
MKKLLLIVIILVSFLGSAQRKCTIDVKKYGMSTKPGYLKEGIHLNLPDDYYFYLVGEKITIGIEVFDSIAQFRGVEDKFTIMYQDRLCDYMGKKGESCGDTEVSYEISNSPMFNYCRIVYFYYDSYMSTNSIANSWSSISDGDYEIIIMSDDKIYYKRKIKVLKGNLVKQWN